METLAAVADAAEREFWLMLERVTAVVSLEEPKRETVPLIADIREHLELDAADATVLATIVTARRRGLCEMFLSRDEDFQTEPVREYMKNENLKYLTNPDQIVGPIRSLVGKGSYDAMR